MSVSNRINFVVGARGSRLAILQAQIVIAKLQKVAPACGFELRTIKTSGDADQLSALAEMGGSGVFVKEIEAALFSGDIDLAVHSAKDLPAQTPADLTIVAAPERAPVEDALLNLYNASLRALPSGVRLATSSPRRRALMRRHRPDLILVEVRGNLDTRLRKLKEGQFEALIVARAGLYRLGWEGHASEFLPPQTFLPAPCQGILAVEARTADREVAELAALIDDCNVHACLRAERSFMVTLKAGCSVPLGAWARWEANKLAMDAAIWDLQGRREWRCAGVADSRSEAEALGAALAQDLLAQGAGEWKHD